jgi:hypothetical protein
MEAVMNAHALNYPSLQRRLISQRRSRAFFSGSTTQHVKSAPLAREVARAAVALVALATWCTVLLFFAA